MVNIGREWLISVGKDDASCAVKMCALTALEMRLHFPAGVDTYPLVWEGNVEGPENVIREIRRCIMQVPSSALLLKVGIAEKEVSNFISMVEISSNQ